MKEIKIDKLISKEQNQRYWDIISAPVENGSIISGLETSGLQTFMPIIIFFLLFFDSQSSLYLGFPPFWMLELILTEKSYNT
jgi:hypothetical protein